jgi:2-polyprenyl-3-methyl-5-hydroxy-6-metoxy-1,4-benzoquinol methylase
MTTTTEPLATTADYFESVYAEAAGDAGRVPWASEQPSPALVNWLNAVAQTLIRCGARVAIVGCGLGADAREVIRRGYEVIAFDCSDTAIDWARSLDPAHGDSYVRADLFDLPAKWVHRFDLVIEINNIQSLTAGMRNDAVASLSKLVAPHGHLLVVTRGAQPEDVQTAPPPLTRDQLLEATTQAGLAPEGPVCCFTDDEDVPRIRAVFRRP